MEFFLVSKSNGSLVPPSGPTPSEILDLSRIDRLPVLRCNARTLHVFGPYGAPGAAQFVIREALAKALVPYYPLAGRLKESSTDSLKQDQLQIQIECSGQGVWFVEASADCSLSDVGYFDDVTSIPFDKLLPHPPPQSEGIDPLVLMQVTEFEGDGFVMGLTFCHTICDGLGAAQFLNAIGEFARGVHPLTVPPVWHRDFLPLPSSQSKSSQLSNLPSPMPTNNYDQLEQANIDIPLDRINQLKHKFAEESLGSCSTFEVIAACLWAQRTRAILKDLSTTNTSNNNKMVTLVFFANCRQLVNPPLPKGFYGNCFFPVTVTASSETVTRVPISDVVKLIQEAKANLPYEFDKWVRNKNKDADPFTPPLAYTTLFISDWGRLGFNEVDYGMGPPLHVVPMQGSTIIPVAIVGSLPRPNKGIRLMTWCVHNSNLQPFLHHMTNLI